MAPTSGILAQESGRRRPLLLLDRAGFLCGFRSRPLLFDLGRGEGTGEGLPGSADSLPLRLRPTVGVCENGSYSGEESSWGEGPGPSADSSPLPPSLGEAAATAAAARSGCGSAPAASSCITSFGNVPLT